MTASRTENEAGHTAGPESFHDSIVRQIKAARYVGFHSGNFGLRHYMSDEQKDYILNALASAPSLQQDNERLRKELDRAVKALKMFRSIVDEGGVPRYSIISGAALNSVIEEDVDPAIRSGSATLAALAPAQKGERR